MSSPNPRYEENVLVLRLPATLKAALREQAMANKESMNTFVARTLGEKLGVEVELPRYVSAPDDVVADTA